MAPYEQVFPSISMKTNNTDWNKMVHAPFKKVVKFDLICMGIGNHDWNWCRSITFASGFFG